MPTKILRFYYPGFCQICEGTANNALNPLKQRINSKDFNGSYVTIAIDDSDLTIEEECKEALTKVGFEPTDDPNQQTLKKSFHKTLLKALLTTLPGIAICALCMTGLMLPMWACYFLAVFSFLLATSCSWEIFHNAWKQKALNVDTLLVISVLTLFTTSVIGLAYPNLNLPMRFDAVLMILGFKLIGKAIEKYCALQVGPPLNFSDKVPTHVFVKGEPKGEPIAILKENVVVGDILTVNAGQVIPVDSTYIENQDIPVELNNKFILGTNKIYTPSANQKILAGTEVAKGPIEVRADKIFKNSYLAQLDQDREQNKKHRQTQVSAEKNFLNSVSRNFTRLVLIVALASFLYAYFTGGFVSGLSLLLTVVVAACPCALGIIFPYTLHKGKQKAENQRITVTNNAMLENFYAVTDFVLDINGTLTKNETKVLKLDMVEEKDTEKRTTILKTILNIESHSTHAVGNAIREHLINEENIIPESTPQECKNGSTKIFTGLSSSSSPLKVEVISGGMSATTEETTYYIGDSSLMQEKNIAIPAAYSTHIPLQQKIYFARKTRGISEFLGCFTVEDPLRLTTKSFVRSLKNMGKTLHICTGANKTYADEFAKELGIDPKNVYSREKPDDEKRESSPESKKEIWFPKKKYILSLKQSPEKTVAMIGDGTNDVGAFNASDYAISVYSSTSPAQLAYSNDAMVHGENLMGIIDLLKISKQTQTTILQSIFFSIVYSAISVGLPAVFSALCPTLANPGVTAGFMVGQALLIMLNAYRFEKAPLDVGWASGPTIVAPELGECWAGGPTYVSPAESLYNLRSTCPNLTDSETTNTSSTPLTQPGL